MATDLKKITTLDECDQAISDSEEAIAKEEAAQKAGAPSHSIEMLENMRAELRGLERRRAELAGEEQDETNGSEGC